MAKQASQEGANSAARKPRGARRVNKPRAVAVPVVSKSAAEAAAKGKTTYPFVSDPARAANMRSNRRADTKPEIALRTALHAMGYRYRKDFRLDLPLRRVRPDIAFTSRKVAVFVDGCFWHGCPEHGTAQNARSNSAFWLAKVTGNQARDADTTAALEALGYRVLRFWEHEDVAAACDAIERALASDDGAE